LTRTRTTFESHPEPLGRDRDLLSRTYISEICAPMMTMDVYGLLADYFVSTAGSKTQFSCNGSAYSAMQSLCNRATNDSTSA